MNKDLIEIKELMEANLPIFTFEDFSKFHATDIDWGTSKRQRTVKATLIVAYGLWHEKLLARTFYIQESYFKKQREHCIFEVNRQLAGNQYKLYCRLFNSGFGGSGFRVWVYEDKEGWKIGNYDRYNVSGIYNNYTGTDIVGYEKYNDPFLYLNASIHKYCGVTKEYPSYNNNELFNYLYRYEKHPQLEMLLKMRLEHLTKDLRGFKWSEKGIHILNIDNLEKWEIQYLKYFTVSDYKKIRCFIKKWKLTVAQAVLSLNLQREGLDVTRRLITYFEEESVTTYNYKDYLRYMDLLGTPKENKYLYPKNFHQAHQEQIKKYTAEKDSQLDERIKELNDSLSKYEYNNEKYAIRPAASYLELIDEGKALHHCVASYGERMASGKCVIMVIRENEHLDTPLYTLEFQKNKVVQCRGAHNEKPCDEAIAFVYSWAKKNRMECNLWKITKSI